MGNGYGNGIGYADVTVTVIKTIFYERIRESFFRSKMKVTNENG
jgi:hypothetical protein